AQRRLALGSAVRRYGRESEAIKIYEEGLAAAVNQPDFWNGLAWCLATSRDPELRDGPRAVELANKAIAARAKEASFWNTLGVASYRAGNLSAAIEAFDNSTRLNKGGGANDWFFQAMIRWKLGENDLARKLFDQAVRWTD